MLGQRIAQLHQQLLQCLYIGTHHAALQQTAPKRNFRCGVFSGSFPVLDKGQLVPVLPLAILHLRAHTAIAKAAPFHGIAVADIVTYMPVRVQRQTDDLRKRVNRAPIHALGFCPCEHGVGSLVRAAIRAVFIGHGSIRADSVQHGLTAICPRISFCAADAVANHLLVSDILLVPAHARGGVMGRILLGLSA